MSTDVESLVEMGFPRNRAEKALSNTRYKGVQQAMDWMLAHGDDPDIDEPFEAPKGQVLGESSESGTSEAAEAAAAVAKSLKCDECGKLLKNPEAAELHAARSGHANFSESVEEIKPLTKEEKEEQLQKVQDRIQQKRLEKEDQDRKEKLSKEKMRRTQGKEMSSVRQKFEEDEIKKMMEQKRREKEDEKLARQRVKDQIERDKIDRAKKFPKAGGQTTAQSPVAAAAAPSTSPAATQEKKEYNETRIQIRLTNGTALTHVFGVKEPLSAVRLYTQMNRSDEDGIPTFMTSFPRKVFSDSDMDAPLESLGLVPSAVLIVTKPK